MPGLLLEGPLRHRHGTANSLAAHISYLFNSLANSSGDTPVDAAWGGCYDWPGLPPLGAGWGARPNISSDCKHLGE